METNQSLFDGAEQQESFLKLYQYIFDKAPIGIIYYNKNGILTACNDKFVEIIGSTREQLIGLVMTNLPDINIAKAVNESLDGKIGRYQGIYSAKTSGKKTPVKVEFHPLDSYDNNGISGIGIIEDISESYYASRKLKDSEERYHNIFNKSHDPMLLIDTDQGHIRDANLAALKYYGWSYDEMTSMKISDINTMSREEVESKMEKVESNERSSFQFKHRIADGSVRDVEVSSGLIQIEDVLMLFSIIHDITDRKKQEQELQKFKLGIERSSNVVFITDRSGRIEYINPSFTEIYGYKLDDVKGKTPRILKSGIKDSTYYEEFWSRITHGKVMSDEILNKTKEGKLINIKFSSNPIINDENNIIGYIAIQENITEQKQKDQKLQESLKEKEILLSEIHHRVKNNLAIISGLLELNLYQDVSISTEEVIKSSQLRIKAIANVHEMLYESETFSQISFRDYIIRLTKSIQKTAESDNFKPEFVINVDDVFLNINQAIPTGLILNELLMNALKHAFPDRDTGTVYVTGKFSEGLISLEVKDDEVGISDTSKVEGDTLGMTLIKILSQQLSGNLEMGNSDIGYRSLLSFAPILDAKGSSTNII